MKSTKMINLTLFVFFCSNSCTLLAKGHYGRVYSFTEKVNNKDVKVVLKKSSLSDNYKLGKVVYHRQYKYILPDVSISLSLSHLKAFPRSSYYCENFANILSNHFVFEDIKQKRHLITEMSFVEKLIHNLKHISPKRGMSPKQRRHLITKMSYAGKPIWKLRSISPKTAISLARQLIASLAVAESALEFEHRDLHLGNVLVLKTNSKSVNFKMNGKSFTVELNGFKLNIIDTTFSRITFRNEIHFTRLAKTPTTIAKTESSKLSYNLWIYKKQCQLTDNDWSRFCPKSNIYWTHLQLKHIFKMTKKSIFNQRYESKNDIRLLEKWKNTITQYNSVLEFQTTLM